MDSSDLDSQMHDLKGAATAEAFPAPSVSPHGIVQYPDHIPPLSYTYPVAQIDRLTQQECSVGGELVRRRSSRVLYSES